MGNPSTRPRQRRPSIKTVAALAGVSWSTVSNVINNHPSVRPETRAKVEEAIEILGYKPNAAARTLRRSESETVLLMASELNRPLTADLLEAVTSEVRSRGLSAQLEVTAHQSRSVTRSLEHARAHDHTGTILIGYQDPSFARGPASAHPLLIASRLGDEESTGAVTCDLRREVSDLVGTLLERGARRPTLIVPPTLQTPLLDLFVSQLAAHGAPAGTGAVVTAHDDTIEAGAAAATRLTANGGDAVVCASEELARGVLSQRPALLPEHLLSCLRASRLLGVEHPGIATTSPDLTALASLALDIVLSPEPPLGIQLAPHRCPH